MTAAEFAHDPFAAETWWTGEAVAQLLTGCRLDFQSLSFAVPMKINIGTAGRADQVLIAEVSHVRATRYPYRGEDQRPHAPRTL